MYSKYLKLPLLSLLLMTLAGTTMKGQKWLDPSEATDVAPIQRRLTTDDGLYKSAGADSMSDGLLVEFYTASPTIRVRLTADGAYPSGIDLYATDCHGATIKCRQTSVAGDVITFDKPVRPSTHKQGDRCRLYLPLGVTVKSLHIVIDGDASLLWLPDRLERPILTVLPRERGKAPSETRSALLERALDIPVLTLPEEVDSRLLSKSSPRLLIVDSSISPERLSELSKGISCPVVRVASGQDLVPVVVSELRLKQDWVCPPVTQSRDMASYVWEKRHNEVVLRNRTTKPEVLVMGNSIMHYWSGLPASQHHRGDDSWEKLFGDHTATNMGFGWDRIENLNWRLIHGELDDCDPKVILLAIGTNNISAGDDNERIARGIAETAALIRERKPGARLYVCGILPRKGEEGRVRALNMLTESLISVIPGATFIDISEGLTGPDGAIKSSLYRDGLHPTGEGYRIIGANLGRLVTL